MVHVHEGTTTSGKVVTTFACPWPKPGTGQLIASTALADGVYTAVATEQSGVGNGTGESESRSFEVFTHPPAVEFTNVPAERSRKRSRRSKGPRLRGKPTPVIVHVYEGAGTSGKEVVALKATFSGSKWSVSVVTELPEGSYTAQATQASSIENEPGASRAVEFEVVTGPPVVMPAGAAGAVEDDKTDVLGDGERTGSR